MTELTQLLRRRRASIEFLKRANLSGTWPLTGLGTGSAGGPITLPGASSPPAAPAQAGIQQTGAVRSRAGMAPFFRVSPATTPTSALLRGYAQRSGPVGANWRPPEIRTPMRAAQNPAPMTPAAPAAPTIPNEKLPPGLRNTPTGDSALRQQISDIHQQQQKGIYGSSVTPTQQANIMAGHPATGPRTAPTAPAAAPAAGPRTAPTAPTPSTAPAAGPQLPGMLSRPQQVPGSNIVRPQGMTGLTSMPGRVNDQWGNPNQRDPIQRSTDRVMQSVARGIQQYGPSTAKTPQGQLNTLAHYQPYMKSFSGPGVERTMQRYGS